MGHSGRIKVEKIPNTNHRFGYAVMCFCICGFGLIFWINPEIGFPAKTDLRVTEGTVMYARYNRNQTTKHGSHPTVSFGLNEGGNFTISKVNLTSIHQTLLSADSDRVRVIFDPQHTAKSTNVERYRVYGIEVDGKPILTYEQKRQWKLDDSWYAKLIAIIFFMGGAFFCFPDKNKQTRKPSSIKTKSSTRD